MSKKIAKPTSKRTTPTRPRRSTAPVTKPRTATSTSSSIQLHRYVGIAVAIAIVGVLLSSFFNWKLQQVGFEIQQTVQASQSLN